VVAGLGAARPAFQRLLAAAVALVAVAIVVTGWHSLAEVSATVLLASAGATGVLASVAAPLLAVDREVLADVGIGVTLVLVSVLVGVTDAGRHTPLAVVTGLVFVAGIAFATGRLAVESARQSLRAEGPEDHSQGTVWAVATSRWRADRSIR
jgi:hypothetical protein